MNKIKFKPYRKKSFEPWKCLIPKRYTIPKMKYYILGVKKLKKGPSEEN